MDRPTRPALRFSVMFGKGKLARWQASAIRRLIESGHARLVAWIDEASTRSPDENGRSNFLWRLFISLDPPAALRSVALPRTLTEIPRIEYASDEDVNAVRAHDLDFILRFGTGEIKGPILESATYGVWSFKHGDESRRRGGPPYFWEICDRDPVSAATLERVTEAHFGSAVLRQGFLQTIDYSYSRNYDRMLMESANWPMYVAAAIRCGAFRAPEETSGAKAIGRNVYPSFLATLRFIAVIVGNIVRRAVARCFREEWSIGIVPLAIEDISRGARLRGVKWFTNPAGGWVADPMALARQGHVDVLCELMDLKAERGYVAATRFDGRNWSRAKPVLQTRCHAAYPYLLEDQGQILCIPETSDASEVRLYRAVDFPNVWEEVATLLPDFAAVDSTIFRHNNLWWLFATLQDASDYKLFAWYAPGLLGKWRPHMDNPIKIDARGARPAGPPFWSDGVLFRPAQDCSKTYGGRIVLNRVTELTPTRFREEAVSYVEPDARSPFGKGLHTLSPAGNWCVIDGKRWRLKRLTRTDRAPVNSAPKPQSKRQPDRDLKALEAALR